MSMHHHACLNLYEFEFEFTKLNTLYILSLFTHLSNFLSEMISQQNASKVKVI